MCKCFPTITGLLFLTISMSVSAQISIADDTKKYLLNTAKPLNSSSTSSFQLQTVEQKNGILNNKYIDAYNNYKYKGISLMDKDLELSGYPKIKDYVFKYTSPTPVNLLPNGTITPVYMGGHFVIVPLGGLVVPSGMSLTGGGPKKLSEKTKNILRNVYGMQVDD